MLGSIVGAIFGSKSAKKQQKMLDAQRRENKSWYNQRYNEVGTQRADAQAALTAMRNAMKDRMAAARGAAAVGGASAESVAQEKAAQNQSMANVISAIDQSQEARKDSIENAYRSTDADILGKKLGVEQKKQEQIAAAGSAVDATINKAIGTFGGGLLGGK